MGGEASAANSAAGWARQVFRILSGVALGLWTWSAEAQFFYLDDGGDLSLRRIEADGSTNRILVDGAAKLNHPSALSAPAGTRQLYFMDLEGSATVLKRVDYDGNNLVTVVSEPDLENRLLPGLGQSSRIWNYWVDGPRRHLYLFVWVAALDRRGATIFRTELTPTNVVTVVPPDRPILGSVRTFQVDAAGGRIYVETLDGIVRSTLDGANPETVFSGNATPDAWLLLSNLSRIALPHRYDAPEVRLLELNGAVASTSPLSVSAIPALTQVENIYDLFADAGTNRFYVMAHARLAADRSRVPVILSYDQTLAASSGKLHYIFPPEHISSSLPDAVVAADTSPVDPGENSALELTPFLALGIAIPTSAGVTYQIQYTDDLAAQPVEWKLLQTLVGNGATNTVFDPTPVRNRRVYRAVVAASGGAAGP